MLHTQPSTQEVRWRQEDKEFKASLAWLHHESEASLGCDILFQEEGQKRRAFVSEFYFFSSFVSEYRHLTLSFVLFLPFATPMYLSQDC